MVAGICVGIERQMKNKYAGLKTNALVAVGAAILWGYHSNISIWRMLTLLELPGKLAFWEQG